MKFYFILYDIKPRLLVQLLDNLKHFALSKTPFFPYAQMAQNLGPLLSNFREKETKAFGIPRWRLVTAE